MKEIVAAFVGAALILGPLLGASSGKMIGPSDALGWLTFAVLVFQALIFLRQRDIMHAQTKLIDQQAIIARQSHIASHRANLKAKNFRVHYSVDRRIQVDFVTVNVGSTNAYIVGRNVTVVLLRYPGEIFGLPFLPTQIATGSDDPIKGGEQVVHTCVDGTPLTEEDFDAINRSEKHLHVLGQVTYTDDNGIFRNVGFFRCYIVDLARFSKIDNDDFEYGY